ncbi:MAG TPA: enoyl-CoA hydratase/isomerase family protein [Anaerolineales bacterium]|nr:enoyl-CoA hydratase/isomerase family protein [Anaerolineales bacterium]
MTEATEILITTQIQAGVAYLTLDRPPLNVLNIPMLQQLEAALDQLSRDQSVRTLVLNAKGKIFSAGVDVADHTADKVDLMIPLVDRVCQALAELPIPTVAAVHGHALGGGCELVLCCDLAVMAEEASIGQPEVHLAALAPVAALRLPYLVGYRAAADLMFTGRRLGAQEAHRMGLVNAVVPQDQLSARVEETALELTRLSRAALSLVKKALHLGYGAWTRSMPEMEQLYLQDLMNTADAHEGLAAFMAKRSPNWEHK